MDFYFNYFSRIGGESTLIVICHLSPYCSTGRSVWLRPVGVRDVPLGVRDYLLS